MPIPPFEYQDLRPLGPEVAEDYPVTHHGVRVTKFEGQPGLKVSPDALTEMARTAFRDCSFLLRPAHLAQVAAILGNLEASDNDRFVLVDDKGNDFFEPIRDGACARCAA